jgi:hypothetical protein
MEGVLHAMMVTRMKVTALALAGALAVLGAGTASYRALAEEGGSAGEPASPAVSPAEVRVSKLKKEIAQMTRELRKAEEQVAREKAVPPRKKPVAIIFGDVAITRDELADHLLSRMTARQLDSYVTRRILEHACKKEGITVTAEEVDAYLKARMGNGAYQQGPFRARLQREGLTLREWKEDVARTQLMLEKLSRRRARVTQQDLRREYQARYGRKVECQFLIWPAGEWDAAERAARLLRAGKTTFEELARQRPQAVRPIVINRQGTRPRRALEKAAFALAPGEVSEVIDFPQGFLLLKCQRHIPADQGTTFEQVRAALKRDLEGRGRQKEGARLLAELKAEARAKLLWKPPEDREPSK